jgi:hypothetical protein
MPESCSRRKFITNYFCATAVFFGGELVLGACTSKNPAHEETSSKPNDPCGDFTGVTESELEKRTKLGYVREAPAPDKQCNGCKLYLPPKPNEKCGGCMLFKGPVDSNGSCTYWAPLV